MEKRVPASGEVTSENVTQRMEEEAIKSVASMVSGRLSMLKDRTKAEEIRGLVDAFAENPSRNWKLLQVRLAREAISVDPASSEDNFQFIKMQQSFDRFTAPYTAGWKTAEDEHFAATKRRGREEEGREEREKRKREFLHQTGQEPPQAAA